MTTYMMFISNYPDLYLEANNRYNLIYPEESKARYSKIDSNKKNFLKVLKSDYIFDIFQGAPMRMRMGRISNSFYKLSSRYQHFTDRTILIDLYL